MQKKTALILVADGFQDEEFVYPYYRLKEDGWLVDVYPGGKGKYGVPAKPEGTVAISAWDLPWQLLIIPGGWQSPELVRQMPECISIVRAMNKMGRVIAAICHGPQVLISAGIIADMNATCYKGMKDDLVNAGANWSNDPVVAHVNIVTAQHYRDSGAFMAEALATVIRLSRVQHLETHAI